MRSRGGLCRASRRPTDVRPPTHPRLHTSISFQPPPTPLSPLNANIGAVLVTGCDTGFGHDLALRLYERGWVVYAGCLQEASVGTLKEQAGGPSMRAVLLDVTQQGDIDRVLAQITNEGLVLRALVNNAGVGRGGVVDWMPLEEFRRIMDVNFFAQVAMVKACLPLLKESKGRIVNVTSLAGLFLGAPCMAAYCASKHAAEAFSTSLRLEMKAWGIKVITVNPSFHRTLIADGAATVQSSYDALDPQTRDEYGPQYLRACRSICNRALKSSWNPDNVVKVLVNATTASNPRIQYIVGGDAKFGLLPILHLPTRVAEGIISYVLLSRLVPAKTKQATQEENDEQPQEASAAALELDTKQHQHKHGGGNLTSTSSGSSKSNSSMSVSSMSGSSSSSSFSALSSTKDKAALTSSPTPF